MSEDLQHHKSERFEAATGWGTPVGLALVVVSLGFLLLCFHWTGILD